jgi:hypothetical protein
VWVRGYGYQTNPDSLKFVLAIDKHQCLYVDTRDLDDWVQVRCPRVALAAGTHELLIQVVGDTSTPGTSGSFSIDDIVVVPVA